MFDARRRAGAAVCVAMACTALHACRQAAPPGPIKPVYDVKIGKLTQLIYDADHDGRPDTWSFMDGPRIVRIEIDTDRDGRVDRWEYFGTGGTLEKVGTSRGGDAIVDTWMYPNADGSVSRVEQSTRRDGRVTRVEYYTGGALSRAEEDADEDGRPDKWETYRGAALASVAYDTTHAGKPDRRFIYKPDGTLDRIEDGAGRRIDGDQPVNTPRRPSSR